MIVVTSETRALANAFWRGWALALIGALLLALDLWLLQSSATSQWAPGWWLLLAAQVVWLPLIALTVSQAWLALGVSSQAGNGMPVIQLRGPWLVSSAWAGADHYIEYPWTDIKRVSARLASEESAPWRRARLLSEEQAASLVVITVDFEDGRRPLISGSLMLQIAWLALTLPRTLKKAVGIKRVRLIVDPSPQRARALVIALNELSLRPDIRERFSAERHVWYVEADEDGSPVMVMAGGKHRERLATLLARPLSLAASWGAV